MKKTRILTILVMATILCFSSAVLASDATSAIVVMGTPTIDGVMEGLWNYADYVETNIGSGVSGSCKILWDTTHLYLFVEVSDAKLFSMGESYNNDSIDIWLSETGTISEEYANPGDNAYRIDIDGIISSKTNSEALLDNSVYTETSEGYSYEMSIAFSDSAPSVGTIIGFNISLNNDEDGDGSRDEYVSWVDPGTNYWSHPNNLNEVTFVGAPAISTPETGDNGVLTIVLSLSAIILAGAVLILSKSKKTQNN